MISLRLNGFNAKGVVALVKPKCTTGILLAINIVGENGRTPGKEIDQRTVATLTRRFGTLVGVYKGLRTALDGNESKARGEVTRKLYGHITYQKRSNVVMGEPSGKFNLMVPISGKEEGGNNASQYLGQDR